MNAGPRGLRELRLRLLNQLDQKTGAEKRILRRTVAEIERRLRGAEPRGLRAREAGGPQSRSRRG